MPGGKPYTNLRRILNFNRRRTRNVTSTQGTSINRLDYKISLPYSCSATTNKNGKKRSGNARLIESVILVHLALGT